MHCANIGKASAGVYDSKFFTYIALEEEQSRIFLCRICSLFLFRINITVLYLS